MDPGLESVPILLVSLEKHLFKWRSAAIPRSNELVLTGFTAAMAEPLINSFPDLKKLCINDRDGCPCSLLGSSFTAFPNLRILTLICDLRCAQDIMGALTRILEFRNGVYIGKPSIPLRPLEKIIIKRWHAWDPAPYFYDPEPIPDEFESAISEWVLFQVDVQFDQ